MITLIHYNCETCKNFKSCPFYINLVECENTDLTTFDDYEKNIQNIYCKNFEERK